MINHFKLEWLFPSDGYTFDVEWDSLMCQNGVGVTEVQRLYKLALQRKLENEEEQKFKDEIKVLIILIQQLEIEARYCVHEFDTLSTKFTLVKA